MMMSDYDLVGFLKDYFEETDPIAQDGILNIMIDFMEEKNDSRAALLRLRYNYFHDLLKEEQTTNLFIEATGKIEKDLSDAWCDTLKYGYMIYGMIGWKEYVVTENAKSMQCAGFGVVPKYFTFETANERSKKRYFNRNRCSIKHTYYMDPYELKLDKAILTDLAK